MIPTSYPSPVRLSRATETRIRARSLLSWARPLPSFLVIGVQRAGTTTFFGNLSAHPDVRPPIRKEVHYFTSNFERGIKWYRAHFPLSTVPVPKWQTFEATPYYLFHPLVPARVQEALPAARFVVILRDPVDRAVSHYRLNIARKNEHLSFDEAIKSETERVPSSIENLPRGSPELDRHRVYSYLARGRYIEQLERWFSIFDRERFHIVDFAELVADPRKSISRTLAFLGLRDAQEDLPQRRGMTTSGAASPIAAEHDLSQYYHPYNERLFELLGRRFDWK